MGKVITHGVKTNIYDADVVNIFLDTQGGDPAEFITTITVRGSVSVERVNRVLHGDPGILNVHIH